MLYVKILHHFPMLSFNVINNNLEGIMEKLPVGSEKEVVVHIPALLETIPLRYCDAFQQTIPNVISFGFAVTGFDLWGSVFATGIVCTFYCTLVCTYYLTDRQTNNANK